MISVKDLNKNIHRRVGTVARRGIPRSSMPAPGLSLSSSTLPVNTLQGEHIMTQAGATPTLESQTDEAPGFCPPQPQLLQALRSRPTSETLTFSVLHKANTQIQITEELLEAVASWPKLGIRMFILHIKNALYIRFQR